MIFLIDKLFIFWLYMNVLDPRGNLFAVPAGKMALVVSGYIYLLFLVRRGLILPRRLVRYVGLSMALVGLLAVVGFLKGNVLEDIGAFLTPLLILPLIPMFILLFCHYGADRYVLHLMRAVTLLALYVLTLFVLAGLLEFREVGPLVMSRFEHTSISYPAYGIRVNVSTGGFYSAGIMFALYFATRLRRPHYVFYALTMSFALVLSQALGLWLGMIAALVVFGVRHLPSTRLATLSILAVVFLAGGWRALPAGLVQDKLASITQKVGQSHQALELFAEKPILGEGLGHLYRNYEVADVSGIENLFIEASYAMILSSTGLLGALIYLYIYLYYPGLSAWQRNYDTFTALLLASHVAVLVAAAGNPYIWSGGMGLFFVAMIAARLESGQINRLIERATGGGERQPA